MTRYQFLNTYSYAKGRRKEKNFRVVLKKMLRSHYPVVKSMINNSSFSDDDIIKFLNTLSDKEINYFCKNSLLVKESCLENRIKLIDFMFKNGCNVNIKHKEEGILTKIFYEDYVLYKKELLNLFIFHKVNIKSKDYNYNKFLTRFLEILKNNSTEENSIFKQQLKTIYYELRLDMLFKEYQTYKKFKYFYNFTKNIKIRIDYLSKEQFTYKNILFYIKHKINIFSLNKNEEEEWPLNNIFNVKSISYKNLLLFKILIDNEPNIIKQSKENIKKTTKPISTQEFIHFWRIEQTKPKTVMDRLIFSSAYYTKKTRKNIILTYLIAYMKHKANEKK